MRYKVYERGFLHSARDAESDALTICETDDLDEAMKAAEDWTDDAVTAVVKDTETGEFVDWMWQ